MRGLWFSRCHICLVGAFVVNPGDGVNTDIGGLNNRNYIDVTFPAISITVDGVVYDLDYDATDRIYVAGTLGRGAWVLEE